MSRFRWLRPSPGTVIAVVALVFSLGGVAWALGTGVVTSDNIKDGTVRSIDMKNGAGVKGVDVVDKSLTDSDVAGLRTLRLKKVSPSVTAPTVEAARGSAFKIELFRQGPFTIYAKCFRENGDTTNPGVWGELYIRTRVGGAIFSSKSSNTSNGFFKPSTPESDRQLDGGESYAGSGNPGTLNITDPASFYAAVGTTVLNGTYFIGTKVGSPPAGNGVFGAGDRCIFGGTILSH
jgi:hypothetical protein